MTDEQISSSAAQQECNNIVSTFTTRCIALAADLAIAQSRLAAQLEINEAQQKVITSSEDQIKLLKEMQNAKPDTPAVPGS